MQRRDLYEGLLLSHQIIKLIIISFSIGVLLFFTALGRLSLHLQRSVTLADSAYALCRQLPVR